MSQVHCVTGAFGYSGRVVAERLLDAGARVRTLTTKSGAGHPLEGRVERHDLAFGDTRRLTATLTGVDTLFNTYWVRFAKAGFSQEVAVRHTVALFEAARAAGVRRVVHTSITNPSIDSPYEYFRGKARLEEALRGSGLSYGILRPAVFFGRGDILVNNIAWVLRRLPVFGCFGDGRYRIRAIHVEDFARLAVRVGASTDDAVLDAVGPEDWAYEDLARMIGEAIGCPRPVVGMPWRLGLAAAWGLGKVLGDIVLTREEIGALMDDLLTTEGPATGGTALGDWVHRNATTLGRTYGHELARRR